MAPDPQKSTPDEGRPTSGEGASQPTPDDSSPLEPTPAGPAPAGTRARAPREVLRDFLYRGIAYVKARKLYPPGHERLAKQLANWLEAAEAVFTHQEEISFFVQPEAIFVSGEEFGADDRVAEGVDVARQQTAPGSRLAADQDRNSGELRVEDPK